MVEFTVSSFQSKITRHAKHKEKNQSLETDPELTHMLELAEKDVENN